MPESRIFEYLGGARRAAVLGHINPDGDCVGSCLGMYNYLRSNYPQLKAQVFLEEPDGKFGFLPSFGSILSRPDGEHYERAL